MNINVLLQDIDEKNKPIHPYHKYFHLAASVAFLFGDNRSFDLSDYESHLLEHLYKFIYR